MNTEDLAHQQRFLMEAEQSIRVANREVISTHIPPLTTENILPFAISVARLRARYLDAAFKFSEKEHGDALDEPEVTALRHHRDMYEEARDAFEALRTAIERGYVDLG
tara:strand:- start:68 stop:391 length:324 start_codon:yes stop_codon:yes gene_type:complete